MPDQRAPLWWSNGVERLVIESRFIGQAGGHSAYGIRLDGSGQLAKAEEVPCQSPPPDHGHAADSK